MYTNAYIGFVCYLNNYIDQIKGAAPNTFRSGEGYQVLLLFVTKSAKINHVSIQKSSNSFYHNSRYSYEQQ